MASEAPSDERDGTDRLCLHHRATSRLYLKSCGAVIRYSTRTSPRCAMMAASEMRPYRERPHGSARCQITRQIKMSDQQETQRQLSPTLVTALPA